MTTATATASRIASGANVPPDAHGDQPQDRQDLEHVAGWIAVDDARGSRPPLPVSGRGRDDELLDALAARRQAAA